MIQYEFHLQIRKFQSLELMINHKICRNHFLLKKETLIFNRKRDLGTHL